MIRHTVVSKKVFNLSCCYLLQVILGISSSYTTLLSLIQWEQNVVLKHSRSVIEYSFLEYSISVFSFVLSLICIVLSAYFGMICIVLSAYFGMIGYIFGMQCICYFRSTWKRSLKKWIVLLLKLRSLRLNYTKRKRTVRGTKDPIRNLYRLLQSSMFTEVLLTDDRFFLPLLWDFKIFRISSKVKKFVKAHSRNSRIQDQLKRQVF